MRHISWADDAAARVGGSMGEFLHMLHVGGGARLVASRCSSIGIGVADGFLKPCAHLRGDVRRLLPADILMPHLPPSSHAVRAMSAPTVAVRISWCRLLSVLRNVAAPAAIADNACCIS